MTVLNIGDWIALTVGSVAIVSSVIAPIITAGISRGGASKRQAKELFFHAKLKAYNDLIDTISYSDVSTKSPDDLRSFLSILSRAQIFANANTFQLIDRCNESWTSVYLMLRKDRPYESEKERLNQDFERLIQSMREELMEFQQPLRKHWWQFWRPRRH